MYIKLNNENIYNYLSKKNIIEIENIVDMNINIDNYNIYLIKNKDIIIFYKHNNLESLILISININNIKDSILLYRKHITKLTNNFLYRDYKNNICKESNIIFYFYYEKIKFYYDLKLSVIIKKKIDINTFLYKKIYKGRIYYKKILNAKQRYENKIYYKNNYIYILKKYNNSHFKKNSYNYIYNTNINIYIII